MSLQILKEKNKILALHELYDKYSKDVFKYSFSILKNKDDAKDAVQDVFVKYAQNESSFKGNCSYKTWLLIITRNYCYNKVKSKNFNNERIEDHIFNKYYETDYDTNITIKDSLLQLSTEHNELIYLREYEGYSYKEIAALTEQSIENVKIKIFRARQQLRKLLED